MTVDKGPTFHFREATPKDFYFAQILRQEEETPTALIERFLLNPEVLDLATPSQTKAVLTWAAQTLLSEKILTVENWLEVAFGLSKQRWDQSVEWLESQPMSKIFLMIDIAQRAAKEMAKK